MHLYLIRHAESENNARTEEERVEDPSITARGVRQAEGLAQWLATLVPDVLACSPFRRALQTIAPAAARLGAPVEVWGDIYERGGCYRGWCEANIEGGLGLPHEGIRAIVSQVILDEDLHPQGWWNSRPRESDQAAAERANAVKKRLERTLASSPCRLVLVTHAEFQRLLLEAILSSQGIDVWKLGPIRNAGVTYLEYKEGNWQMHWFNAITHFPNELITGAKG